MDKNIYRCYSPNLYSYLISMNIKPDRQDINKSTKKIYWEFIKSNTLQKYLDKWSNHEN